MTMSSTIFHCDPNKEYYFEEGCYINELSNGEADPAVSIARATVKPGDKTRWHKLIKTIERYVIISGNGQVEIGKLPATEVGPGDTIIIDADDKQRIHNTGKGDLVFLAICSPPFVADNYVDLE